MRGGVLVVKGKLRGRGLVATGAFRLVGGAAVFSNVQMSEEAEKGGSRRGNEYRRKRWVKAFEACDEDNKGYLSREDYKVAVVMLFGYKPSKVEVDSVMASMKHNESGVSLEKFLNLMSTKKAGHFYHSEVRQLFTAFDRQCKGFLSFEDFKKAFSIVAPKLPERTIIEAFREVDQDSDGHISFKDFESAMDYGKDDLTSLPFT